MAVPYFNRDFKRNVRNEAEILFADYLSRHKFTKTLEVFMQESRYHKNNSQTSNISYIQSSYSTIEDMIMNSNFRENANKKYLFSTCKSFADAIAENSNRLINLICENSIYATSRTGLDEFKSNDQYSHSYMNEGSLNNNGTFIHSQASVHGGNFSHDNNGSLSYEAAYNPARYTSNPCNTSILPSSLTNATSYSHTGPSLFYRTESFSVNSGGLNGFRPVDGSRMERPGGRLCINGDVSMDYNGGCFVPNSSSTPRIVGNESNIKKGTHVVLQNGNLTTSNCYNNTSQYIHNNENHIKSTQYNGYLNKDNKNVLNDHGMSILSNNSCNVSNVVSLNGNVEKKGKKGRTNSSTKSITKSKYTKDGIKVSVVSKRKNNSFNDESVKKVQKIDDKDNCRSGVLDFQTTLSPSQYKRAAKDVDLEKEPHLAKKYPPGFNQTGKPFKPENLLNISKFRDGQKEVSKNNKDQSLQQSGKVSNSSILNIPGFGNNVSDRSKTVAIKDNVFKSPTKTSCLKNESSEKDSILINEDCSKISQSQSNTSSSNFESTVNDLSNIQECYFPYEISQNSSLEYNSDGGFDLDSGMLFNPGRDLELFDEIGYCKNDGSLCSNNAQVMDCILPDEDLNMSSLSSIQHSFLVIHPRIRWGQYASPPKERNDELQLEEAISLVKTLPGFSVSQSVIVGTDHTTKKKHIWGQGRIENLLQIKSSYRVSALMINVDCLTPLQQSELHAIFQVPVFDRYNIVLRIFKLYAKTKLAHYQIQLAEIPYIKHRLNYLESNSVSSDVLQITQAVNKLSKSGLDRKEALRLREQALRKRIKSCIESSKNDILEKRLRQNKKNTSNSLVVAVIGYTNVGKTTFIKKITGSSQLIPEDKLFATLDTTIHPFSLPSRSNIFVADTIGFMGSLPVGLFESFSATLMHATSADLLIHLLDLSHPDVFAQKKNVLKSLTDLKFPQQLIDNMICVGNKLDKISDDDRHKLIENGVLNENDLVISCTSGYGIDELILKIDKTIMEKNNSCNQLVTKEPVVSECGQYLIFDICLNDDQLNKLTKKMSSVIKQKKGTL